MSNGMDASPQTPTWLTLSRKTIVLEGTRAAWAFGIGATVTTLSGLLLYYSGAAQLGVPFAVVPALFVLLPSILYVYDRQHERDLVIADAALHAVRPLIGLYHALRTAGS